MSVTSAYFVTALALAAYTPQQGLDAKHNELLCLASGIYFETRGQPDLGKVGVGFVIKNRAKNNIHWPTTYCDVIRDEKYGVQFSFRLSKYRQRLINASVDEVDWGESIGAALAVHYDLTPDITEGATDYCNPDKSKVKWCTQGKMITRIGDHTFTHYSLIR